jgi:type IV pilus assembly protein PilN
MYSLDVNFLRDRPDYLPPDPTNTAKKRQRQPGSMTPLVLGVVIGLLLPALVGGLWFVLQQQIAQKQEEETALDTQLAAQGAQKQKITQFQNQINGVNEETQALATVFNQIKPWSAMLQDIRERTPPGIQIDNIEQTQSTATQSAAPAASSDPNTQAASPPSPPITLEISGTARTFDDVNYFLLTLQRSAFLKGDQTQLVSAELVQNPNKLEVKVPGQQNQSKVTYELPKLVQYKIQTNLSDVPASELLRELDRKGAVGLVTRIRTLQQKGVIQQ